MPTPLAQNVMKITFNLGFLRKTLLINIKYF